VRPPQVEVFSLFYCFFALLSTKTRAVPTIKKQTAIARGNDRFILDLTP
jgi:hypothetical protein